jgi:hypothetical protein
MSVPVETLFSLWDRVCNVRRMCVKTVEGFITRVHGRELFEALECLLDWERYGLKEERAWEKACQTVTRVRSDYNGYEYTAYRAKRKQGGKT